MYDWQEMYYVIRGCKYLNDCDNRENTMNKTSYRTVQSLRVRAHGDIKLVNCAVQNVFAKLTLEVQVKCNKNK